MSIQPKALRIIAEGRIRWVRGTRWEFEVVGETADRFAPAPYRTTLDDCSCPSVRKCAHRLAVELVLAPFREEAT